MLSRIGENKGIHFLKYAEYILQSSLKDKECLPDYLSLWCKLCNKRQCPLQSTGAMWPNCCSYFDAGASDKSLSKTPSVVYCECCFTWTVCHQLYMLHLRHIGHNCYKCMTLLCQNMCKYFKSFFLLNLWKGKKVYLSLWTFLNNISLHLLLSEIDVFYLNC